jgi:hypothetical protein
MSEMWIASADRLTWAAKRAAWSFSEELFLPVKILPGVLQPQAGIMVLAQMQLPA